MSVRSLVTLPRSLVRFHLRGPLTGLAVTTVFVPILGDLPNLILGRREFSLLEWKFGLWMWVLSVLLLVVYFFVRNRVKRAITFYLLVSLAGLPGVAVFLFGGLRAFEVGLGQAAARWFVIGLLLGLATLPWSVRARRAWFRRALESGHLSESLDRHAARWDPRHDNRYVEEDPNFSRPGCLMRLLPWVGPAIGASLADVFGRATSLTLITILSVGIGYSMLYYKFRYAFTNTLELRRLERELGRPITLLSDRDLQRRAL
jgi:hypothetical protein